MTNKPENKTIEQIRDEMALLACAPQTENKGDGYIVDWNTENRESWCDGFDARGKIEEERTKKLVEALRLVVDDASKPIEQIGGYFIGEETLIQCEQTLQEWGKKHD